MQHALATTSFETDLLTDLAGRKRECLTQLHALSQRQLELIEANDMTQLLGLLSAKQRLLVDLQQIERLLDPFRGQDPESRQWRCRADRQRCAELIANSQTLFAEIVAQENQSEAQLQRRRDGTAARLHQAHQAQQARAAYGAFPADATNRLDLSCDQ
jgi:hypothetical protein